MGIRKGFILLPFLAALLAFAACLPKPDEPVEYLQQPDSIVIQMLAVDASLRVDASLDEVAQRFQRIPVFTLYGDGRLIYRSKTYPYRLLQTKLPDNAVRDLLEPIVDAGFLNFSYQQPEPDWRSSSQPTTFVYAHTLDLANAVSAYALDSILPPNSGDEWDQFRALREIAERLQAVDPVALGGSEPELFVPDAVILFERLDFQGEFTETLIEGEQARELAGPNLGMLDLYRNPMESGEAGYLPILPYEENFPEFDIQ